MASWGRRYPGDFRFTVNRWFWNIFWTCDYDPHHREEPNRVYMNNYLGERIRDYIIKLNDEFADRITPPPEFLEALEEWLPVHHFAAASPLDCEY